MRAGMEAAKWLALDFHGRERFRRAIPSHRDGLDLHSTSIADGP
jgi:hypothetical protein